MLSIPKCVGLSYTSSKKRTCPTFQLGGEEIPNIATTVHMGVPLGDVTDNVIAGLISKGSVAWEPYKD